MNRTEFRARIRTSLANPTLQMALDANAERRVNGRIRAWEALPNWRERRQQAHDIRAEVIAHLEQYLAPFINKAKENGIIVHRAKDATEAIQTILKITEANFPGRLDRTDGNRQTPLLVAKSKSMVTEEVNLNHALEAEGIRVVETDLGEYIVQLRGERPAHIITPAVHLRRDDVGRLFHEKLGIPYTEDIPTLTNTARKVLRDVFLNADIGISGVNLGVAETGTLCVVSNEGNARMVTTLPPVHIALMGMERLVRNLDDLAIMLSLLARSATTQKLSVYTQLVHSPFPGQQRHLIIIDNGRTRLLHSPLKESLYCIRCGSCMNACPVFREIGGHAYHSVYPGPIGSVISAGLFGSDFAPLAQASSLCGACKDACPVDIDLPKLLTRVRAGQSETIEEKTLAPQGLTSKSASGGQEGSGLSALANIFLRMYSLAARSPRLFAVSQRLAGLGVRLISPFSHYVRMPAFTGWGYSKDLPRFAVKPFRASFHRDSVNGSNPSIKRQTSEFNQSSILENNQDKLQQFEDELLKVSGTVIHTHEDELTDRVADFLQERGVKQIHLEPNTLDELILEQKGITIGHTPDPTLRAGVTRAVCGLADTGSILIRDGEGYPLQASLLTEIHVAILRDSEILPSLQDALPLTRTSKSAVFITGPSRTGDIEMSHTIGVHGPGEVCVFLVHTIC
jgi:L-lactate dehydrogenase complex protein LldF